MALVELNISPACTPGLCLWPQHPLVRSVRRLWLVMFTLLLDTAWTPLFANPPARRSQQARTHSSRVTLILSFPDHTVRVPDCSLLSPCLSESYHRQSSLRLERLNVFFIPLFSVVGFPLIPLPPSCTRSPSFQRPSLSAQTVAAC